MPLKRSKKGAATASSRQSSATTSPSKPSTGSTPASSPPAQSPVDPSKADSNISAQMQDEELRMASISAAEDAEREQQFAKQREEDRASGSQGVDTKFKALEYLLSQSKLYSTIMLSQMQKQEEADERKDEKSKKRALKREETAERRAIEGQRRSTRGKAGEGDGEDDEKAAEDDEDELAGPVDEEVPGKGRGKKPTSKGKKGQGGIGQYFKKEHVQAKAGKGGVQEALEEEVAKGEGDGVTASDIGMQNLKSARQPELVTGGTMRQYQLEGLDWLTSLYENGLNGILADEMGLGKTIQVISFLAFLREKGTYGPFLIAAPLSTTGNWINEFKRWTPDIPAVLYHGSKEEREEIRRKRLKNPRSKDFPVVCTSYEICMNDRKFLANYGWKFVIIDEGHRIKNLNCRLIRELQSYQSANRLLITGTPLQNNLSELWSLLHFLMPDIFDKLESFESWFDFSALKEKDGYQQILSAERQKNLVSSLHAILKPFLLRRVKADVEHSLPKKREYVLYAPLSQEQRDLYQAILDGDSRSYLEEKVYETLSRNASGANTPQSNASRGTKRKSAAHSASTPSKSAKTSRASSPAAASSSARGRRARKSSNYEEVSDAQFFKQLDHDGVNRDTPFRPSPDSDPDTVNTHAATLALAKKHIAQKKLQNPIMQLRLVCNTVDLFFDRFALADDTGDAALAPDYTALVASSGKMQLLDALLRHLLAQPAHKILIFSQFKAQLDLLALYLTHVLHRPACRIDGAIPQADRQAAIDRFNTSPAHRVFLLSTRAGGQGINLAAADTVVLFDSDWNPQQDLQAQDRAHRIGQRRNVLVFRLATRGTVEELLLEKAEGKRRLEKLVIQKGQFRGLRERRGGEDADDALEELRALLGQADGETMDTGALLSAEELAALTDRSDAAYGRAARGEGEGHRFKTVAARADSGLLEGLSK